jgi:hypothetical protein
MSMTFTKLFASITESTVWCEPDATRITWIAMLAMSDAQGRVWASIPGLANRARVTVDQAKIAIETFLSPDEYSRTPDNEGRRIEAIDGGWRLLNHEKYRNIRDSESSKEAKRKYINERRRKEREAAGESVDGKKSTVDQSRTQSNQAEADTYKSSSLRSEDKAPPAFSAVKELVLLGVDEQTAKDWIATRKAKLTLTAISGLVREAGKAGMSVGAVVALCCERGWRGFKAEWATVGKEASSSRQATSDRRRAFMDELTGRNKRAPDQFSGNVIEGEVL